MTTLPINQFYSGAVNTPGEAAAPIRSQGPDAAAEIQSSDGRTDEAMAREVAPVVGVAALDARLRSNHGGADQAGVGSERSSPSEAIADLLEAIGDECRFVLNEEEFMAAVELPHLRRAG